MERLPIVRLRAVRDDDASFVKDLARDDVAGEWDTFDDAPEDMLSGAYYGGGSKIVELLDETPIGSLTWIQVPYGPNRRSLAWSIGICILPLHRGRHYGAAAQRLLAEQLFAVSDANRVQADTDVDNVAEQRSLEYAGFTRESVMRGAQWRAGAWHDRVIYSLLRRET